MKISGNLLGLHLIPARPDLVTVDLNAGIFGGAFNTSTSRLTLDGEVPTSIGQVADFIATRNFVAAVVYGVSPEDLGGVGSRKAEAIELVTSDKPVQFLGE